MTPVPHSRDLPADDGRDRGMVTAFVVIFATALVFVSALVVDGGRMLAEHRKVNNLADSAARAGAQAISEDAVRDGSTSVGLLDPAEATALACNLLDSGGYPCGGGTTVQVADNEVTVTVRGSIDLLLLPGGNKPVGGEGTACVAVGITTAAC